MLKYMLWQLPAMKPGEQLFMYHWNHAVIMVEPLPVLRLLLIVE
jgi:hypothetical protein